MMRLKDFRGMWDAYPLGTAEEVKARIGGAVNAEWVTNTCAIRLSSAMNASGNIIPGGRPGLSTLKGADGKRYAIRVKELAAYLRAVYGAARSGVGGAVPASFAHEQGIICFDVEGWSDATGHVDLWDGERCVNHGYFERCSAVHLWVVPDGDGQTRAPAHGGPALTASVGERGANRFDDVRLVQELLVSHGVEVGLDGLSGPATIAAIRKFQSRFASKPDGRVDPGGRTFQELLRR